jgi:hypothetical protein
MNNDLPADPPPSAPHGLMAIWPLVLQYGFSDDVEREQVLDGASTEQLMALVTTVDKAVFDLINSYLDETNNAEDSVSYGDLAQAAMEAQFVLKSRGTP